MRVFALLLCSVCTVAFANPYPDPTKVPKDAAYRGLRRQSVIVDPLPGSEVIRVQVDWDEASDTFHLASAVIEHSGTEALALRAVSPDPLGSYEGILQDRETGMTLARASIGTGREFRKLTRALTFRFPATKRKANLRLLAENPQSGEKEEVLNVPLDSTPILTEPAAVGELEVRLLKAATKLPSIKVNIYAEGYESRRESSFWQSADQAVSSLEDNDFPGFERMEFHAVFSPSEETLGKAQNLGLPVAERESFLGLYFPYWDNFGRWYNVLYPTREERFRRQIGRVAYDYPIVLVDSAVYFGIGNFNELTAIPAQSNSFTYLLLHEIGHFFGLNEEYEGGGRTELEFASEIVEPWSQNITFLPDRKNVKWASLIDDKTPIPTPSSLWKGEGPFGAYLGGYADSKPLRKSHKPGFHCIMERGPHFCPICAKALEERIQHDLGEK